MHINKKTYILFLLLVSYWGIICAINLSEVENNPAEYPDIFYEYRFAELNQLSPIEIEFNEQVKVYIELFTSIRKNDFSYMLGMSELYFPIFENFLDYHNLPPDLKYLAVIESGLNPFARSVSGALGLWQFKADASRLFDLEINYYIDERMDAYKSTEAACRYLKYLYGIFNDWHLAIAAYNGGPGVIRSAIQRSGLTNFWELQHLLPEQTRNYVPAFLAAIYVMNHARDHKIEPQKAAFDYYNIDTIHIKHAISFQMITDVMDIDIKQIRFLNPIYKNDFIPIRNSASILILPKNKIEEFISFENTIYGVQTDPIDYLTKAEQFGSTENRSRITYIVKQGDFLHKIAIKYDCTIEDIKLWNKLDNDFLSPGQAIEIWVDNDLIDYFIEDKSEVNRMIEDSNEMYDYYVFQ